MREKNSEIKPCKYEKKVWRRNAVAYLHKKLSSDEEDKIEHIYFNLIYIKKTISNFRKDSLMKEDLLIKNYQKCLY